MVTAEESMAKVLKTEEPETYEGRPIVMKPITYLDDLIIGGSIAQLGELAKANGLSDEMVKNISNLAALVGTMKFALFEQDGETPVFKTLTAAHEASKRPEVMRELNRLYVSYAKKLELSREEKKS